MASERISPDHSHGTHRWASASQRSGCHFQWRFGCTLGGRHTGRRYDRYRYEDAEYLSGKTGDANAWLHSEKEHIIERFSRPSKNYLTYQLTVDDPEVLVKPYTSAPHTWTLAQDPNDVWTEYICTTNEDPEFWKNVDQKTKEEYEKSGREK